MSSEEYLKNPNEFLRLTHRLAGAGLWDWDIASGQLSWSPELYEMLGLDSEANHASFELWRSAVHPEDRQVADARINDALRGRTQLYNEYRIVKPSGEIRWISAHGQALYNDSGDAVRMCGISLDITERKAREDATRQSENLYRSLFDKMLNGFVYCRMLYDHGKPHDFIFLAANDAFVTQTGLKNVVGRKATEVIPSIRQTEPKLFEIYGRVALNGQSEKFEMFVEAQQTRFAVSVYCPMQEHFVAEFEAITERKLAEEALRNSEYRNRLLSETMLHGVVHQDASGTIIKMNPAAELILGKTKDEFLGRNSVEVEHDTIRESGEPFPGMEHPSMVALKTGQPVNAVVMGVYNPKLEAYRWISIGAVPVFRSGEASPSEVFTVFEDITERKRAEVDVTKSEQRFRSLFTEMTEGVALHSLIRDDSGSIINYRIEMVNSAFMGILGLSSKDVTGKLATEAYGVDTPPYLKEYAEVALSRRTLRFETYFPNMDKHFDISVIPWELEGFATIFLDITAGKKAEEFQRQQAEKLQQSQRLESLGVLAGGIAHDFNNILAIIMGNCSLADGDADGTAEYLSQIEKAAQRAADLCRQMLAYAGKAQLVQSQVSIRAVVDGVVKMVKSTVKNNVVITAHLSGDLPSIKADASQISQVALNLILNGAEAIGDEEGEVQVSLTRERIEAGQSEKDYLGKIIPPGWYACLQVSDTGCGMGDEAYNRIFEPFYTTKFAGRGLGMSAVLGIITAQSGAIQLFTEQGKGTTFKVHLPIALAGYVDEATEKTNTQSERWQGSGTILLVEDEEQVLKLAKSMLRRLGFGVVEAANGKEALELYRKNAESITVVVTDMGLPVMDGYALVRELKKANPKLPIIISSGFGDVDISSQISNKEVAGVLSKPYSFAELREVLERVVGNNPN